MLQLKKTKIVATLGPATSTKEVLKAMIEAGASRIGASATRAILNGVK